MLFLFAPSLVFGKRVQTDYGVDFQIEAERKAGRCPPLHLGVTRTVAGIRKIDVRQCVERERCVAELPHFVRSADYKNVHRVEHKSGGVF